MPYEAGSGNVYGLSTTRLRGRTGPVWAGSLYLCCLLMIAAGPVVLGAAVVAPDSERVPDVVTGAVLLLLLPAGLLLWAATARGRRRERRLDRVGVPATAEILASQTVDIGEQDGVRLTLRVTGDGFGAFESVVEVSAEDDLTVGALLPALVDVERKVFAIRG
ncbi:hypothetical protein AB0I28_12200 [Phytomonospora sp. NPDC050363]|uniref:hypothetical protein n=1 Tax=Phytomonospora sp. NPDC050363 TaxID=3155642 RepID=UPI0033D71A4F